MLSRCAQATEEDVEAAFEFGSSVVADEIGGEAAEDGKFADWQPVQAKAEHVVALVGVLNEFLAAR
jgi:hypothetical protein